MSEYKKYSIKTFSGHEFDYNDLHSNTYDINDIAKALSRIPRWLGHSGIFYSVAQHCCWCYDNTQGDPLQALLHDATEAYVSDLPSPVKKLLLDYQEMEYRLGKIIAKKFDIGFPYSQETKEVDHLALQFEWKALDVMENNPWELRWGKFLRRFDLGPLWSSARAEKEFLKRYNNHSHGYIIGFDAYE